MCEYCDIVKREKKEALIYEDDIALAFIPEISSVIGEVIILPKTHYQIIEQVPDEEISHLSILARKLADICFETLSGQGTNILIQNGVPSGQEQPHFSIRILPRRNGDGLNFKWKSDQAKPEDLDSAINILGNETKNIYVSVIETKKLQEPIKKIRPAPVKEEPGEIDYRLDSLRRTP